MDALEMIATVPIPAGQVSTDRDTDEAVNTVKRVVYDMLAGKTDGLPSRHDANIFVRPDVYVGETGSVDVYCRPRFADVLRGAVVKALRQAQIHAFAVEDGATVMD